MADTPDKLTIGGFSSIKSLVSEPELGLRPYALVSWATSSKPLSPRANGEWTF